MPRCSKPWSPVLEMRCLKIARRWRRRFTAISGQGTRDRRELARDIGAEQSHDRAYFEARERIRGRCLDGARQTRYWTAVKLEIARRQGIAIGLIGADMWG
jgi:hypothetical protein